MIINIYIEQLLPKKSSAVYRSDPYFFRVCFFKGGRDGGGGNLIPDPQPWREIICISFHHHDREKERARVIMTDRERGKQRTRKEGREKKSKELVLKKDIRRKRGRRRERGTKREKHTHRVRERERQRDRETDIYIERER